MKAKVVFPAVGNENQWTEDKFTTGKKMCWIVVEADGKRYSLAAREGQPVWTMPVGTELDIEVKAEPANGKHGMAKVAGSGSGLKGYGARPFTIPDKETAAAAADFAAQMFRALKGRLPEITDEAAARLVAAIFNRTT